MKKSARLPFGFLSGLRGRLFLIICLIITPVIILLGIYLNMEIHSLIKTRLLREGEFKAQQIDGVFSMILEDVEDISDFVVTNSTVMKFLLMPKEELVNNYSLTSALHDISFNLIVAKNKISFFHIRSFLNGEDFHISSDLSSGVRELSSYRENPIFMQILKQKGGSQWFILPQGENLLLTDNQAEKLTLGRIIKHPKDSSAIGILFISINTSDIERMCTAGLDTSVNKYRILNSTGTLLLEGGAQLSVQPIRINRRNLTTPSSWVLELITDDRFYFRRITASWLQNTVVIISLIFIAWILVLRVLKKALSPLTVLASSMERFRQGHMEEQVPVESRDEIGQVTEVYNNMVQRIHILIRDNYQLTIREKEAELESLQSRINPHFLYNTLDTIYWMAQEGDNSDIAEMVYALSTIFRNSLRENERFIELRNELEIINHYLLIQKMRMKDGLEVTIRIPEKLFPEEIPKLLLQPLVENSIVHGFKNRKTGNQIFIEGTIESDSLYFVVIDNGQGFYPGSDGLPERALEKEISYSALRNIRDRLTRYYQDEFSFTMENRSAGGTKVLIRLPLRREEIC